MTKTTNLTLAEKELALGVAIVETYPAISASVPASYSAFSADMKSVHTVLRGGCHGRLPYAPVGMDTLLTSFYALTDQEFRWFDFLKIMYADYADYFSLVDSGVPAINFKRWAQHGINAAKDEDYLNADKTPKTWKYIKVTNLDKWPANVLFNFCISSRSITDDTKAHERMFRLIDAGVKPGLAYRLCHCPTSYDNQDGHRYELNKGGDVLDTPIFSFSVKNYHWGTDHTGKNANIIDFVMDTRKVYPKSFKEDPKGCVPTNRIWGLTDDRTANNMFRDTTIRKVMEHFATQQQKAS